MKFRKAFIAIILALSMVTMSACDMFGGGDKGPSYSVKLVLKGGAVENNVTSYKDGDEITLPTPTRENFDFVGWYTDSACEGEKVTKISSSDTGDKTFYAKWTAKTFNVTLNANGGALSGELTSYTYLQGAELPSASRTGYAFGGWYVSENFSGEAVTVISESDSGDKTFHAKWNANKYGLTLNANGGTLKTSVTEYTYGLGLELPEPERTGYRFLGWYTAVSGGEKVTALSTTDIGEKTFYAQWRSKIGKVTLHPNGGTISEEITDYQEGIAKTLPDAQKNYHDFAGWYNNADLTGTSYNQIPTTAEGDVEYWAKWTPKTYTITLNANSGTISGNVTSYVYGTGVTLPTTVTRSGYTFKGWYTANSGGTKVTAVSTTDNGNKTFYARWEANLSTDLTITACAGYAEGIYAEFPKVKNVSSYSVKYKKHSEGDDKYVEIDNELVRINNDTNTVRADIVGISAGTYDIQVVAGDNVALEENITVTAQDRSGYAHFKATSGVGGYNDDGTPKSGAYIIYATEATKNSVKAPWNSNIKGIAYVLSDLNHAGKAVIIRIVGKISAATWDKANWATLKAQYEAAEKTSSGKIKNDSSIVGINGKKLPTSSSDLTQEKLISGGYNKLQTDITELKGLSSKATYSASSTESGYDSCWNNCSISEASNVTVEGIGTDAELFQWGMTWSKCNSIEVRNLTFDDYTEDACSFEGSSDSTTISGFAHTRFWIHNCTFNQGINYWDVCAEQDKREGDGATDFKRLAYVTISYNHYFENHKTGLIGADDKSLTANITFHHNFYDQCQSRLPLARRANMHMYNNYYYGTTNTCLSIRSGGYAFVEYCCFDNAKNPIEVKLGTKKLTGESDYLWGFVKVFNCKKINSSWASSDYIKETNDRSKKYANDNIYNQYFDTDSSAFYYDSTNKKSNVTNLITDTTKISTLIPQQAGVLKPAN